MNARKLTMVAQYHRSGGCTVDCRGDREEGATPYTAARRLAARVLRVAPERLLVEGSHNDPVHPGCVWTATVIEARPPLAIARSTAWLCLATAFAAGFMAAIWTIGMIVTRQ